ncbi:hypothetical protein BJ138DRAFT_1015725 [Hygrophoropsis aurantiaca]|uniref:Uncharacterized protein n=1 Tax=Hygrophoropsis aurantiaca TaxID=72124 RepID=A0ACB8A0V2_9AGAM|nr:hypothetical protein BJ138DRAFT_1015725 [Hygrophoropsis aurantiaca]
MHPCLRLGEIIQIILSYLDLKATTSLARTCQTFQEPSLNIIWSKLDNITPLVRTLPPDLWKIEKYPNKYVFARPMGLEDWTIFHRNARRVRSLRLLCHRGTSAIFTSLSAPPDPSYLFPNLRQLDCEESYDNHDDYINVTFLRHLLRPSLVSLTLQLSPRTYRTMTDLQSLPITCPQIKQLSVYEPCPGQEESPITPDIISQIIRGCHHLQEVTCNRPSDHALHHMAQMASLKTLSIDLGLLERFSPSHHFRGTLKIEFSFVALRAFTIKGPSFNSICQFLKRCRLPVRDLLISSDGDGDDTAHNLIACLPDQCLNDALVKLDIMDAQFDISSQSQGFSIANLRPLCAFTNLSHFSISTICWSLLDDSGLEELAMAWPNLQYFQLMETILEKPSAITLSGLGALIKHCPRLGFISLVIDATVVPIATSLMLAFETRNTKITALDLGNSRIVSPELVAAFLYRIAPNLREIETSLSSTSEGERRVKNWAQVEALMGDASWRDAQALRDSV